MLNPIKGFDDPRLSENKRQNHFGRLTACLVAVFAIFGAASVVAENSTQAPMEEIQAPVEEIVVTAFKRTQSLQDVPSAISVISLQELEDKGIEDMHDIQFAVPSLHYGEYLLRADISIRGVGDFRGNPSVSVSTDGVYQPTGITSKLSQMDIERVEVLRGPQGTLYGRNSNGGAVNFISRAPTPEAEGYIRLGYAEYDELKIRGAYGGPLTERTSFRIAFDRTESKDGWIENLDPVNDDLMFGERTMVRLRLTSQLTKDLELGLLYSSSTEDGSLNHFSFFSDNRELTDPLIQAADITLEPLKTYAVFDDDYDRDYELFSVSVSWDLPFGTLDSISALQEFDDSYHIDGGAFSVFLFDTADFSTTDTFTQELRLGNSGEAFDWLIGVYYMDIEHERTGPFDFPQGAFGLPPGWDLVFGTPKYDTESEAVFIDGTWNFTERARISFGARYTKDDISLTQLQTIALPGVGVIVTLCDRSVSFSDSSTTMRATGQYDLSDNGTVYLSYSEGFKAGGVAVFECAAPYAPEQVDAWELGGKWTLSSGRTTINAALFHYDYSDFQVQQAIGLQTVIRNAGDATIDGAELEVRSNLDEHWSISTGITWLDSEYQDFVNLDGMRPGLGFQQLKGNRLNNTPEFSVNLGVAYRSTLGNGGSLTLRADAAYRDRTYFREFNDRLDSQGPYTIVNFNAVWESADNNWTGRLFAKNLTDEEYKQSVNGDAATGGRFGAWGMPRQVGVEVTRLF